VLVASLAMALGLMLPATAAAAGPAGVFELQGSNGYRIVVLAGADRAGRGGVEVFVGRGHSSARYGAEATVTAPRRSIKGLC